eukprot:snap_masked-scaffold_6-processed-gene-2.13-mRNA-1 protein AED:1.00 eAED:1.00 QI:0/0/0/0/1/1/3/0/77
MLNFKLRKYNKLQNDLLPEITSADTYQTSPYFYKTYLFSSNANLLCFLEQLFRKKALLLEIEINLGSLLHKKSLVEE